MPAKPDLSCKIQVVDGLGSPVSNNGTSHEGATISFTLRNQGGTQTGPFFAKPVIRRYDYKIWDPAPMSFNLAPNQTASFTHSVSGYKTIPFKVTLLADTADDIDESNEANNVAVFSFTDQTII